MSITSALFSGVSGLGALGSAMQVIGDNIANVNTIGFKGARATFQDVLSQTISTAAGTSQVGRGVTLSSVSGLFQQGSFESTNEPTDVAIGGDGFFIIRAPGTTDSDFYTRAGQFQFDKDGYFTNPGGYVVRGWALDENGEVTGSVTDIQLTSFSSAPEATDKIEVMVQLDSRVSSQSTDHLSGRWSGSSSTPIASTAYQYQTSVKVYDSLGDSHDITVYFDPDDTADNKWEFIVTCDPSEDARTGTPTILTGLLARGSVKFNTAGAITNLDTEVYDSSTTSTETNQTLCTGDGSTEIFYFDDGPIVGNSETLHFTSDALGSGDGTTRTFSLTSGHINGNSERIYVGGTLYASGSYSIDDTTGVLTFGTAYVPGNGLAVTANYDVVTDGTYSYTINNDSGAIDFVNKPPSGTVIRADYQHHWTDATNGSSGYDQFQANFTGTAQTIDLNLGTRWDGSSWANEALSTSQYGAASTTIFQTQTGYGSGFLESISVDTDGVITGHYSNGQITELFKLALADFNNPWGLSKEGGNLYAETRNSGDPITGQPGTNGLGRIAPNSLEQSNVDLANEFVKMIINQRGFQANSKIITTVDQMLDELIRLKR
jgi:flagellar hook protein FlgE